MGGESGDDGQSMQPRYTCRLGTHTAPDNGFLTVCPIALSFCLQQEGFENLEKELGEGGFS